MSGNIVLPNESEFETIRAIAQDGRDKPVLMLNLNRYTADAGFPDGDNYLEYMSVLEDLLPRVGAKILWHSPVFGQPVGEQPIDEILAAWYPTHQAFVELPDAPGADENFRLRRMCVEYAVIHRCLGDRTPLSGT
ncbi:MAG: hypothetical protein O7F71_19635 [Gammaproteobacteria bacterium]|nr:hypothetical protein [Gammaproteobacteria bacterium]